MAPARRSPDPRPEDEPEDPRAEGTPDRRRPVGRFGDDEQSDAGGDSDPGSADTA